MSKRVSSTQKVSSVLKVRGLGFKELWNAIKPISGDTLTARYRGLVEQGVRAKFITREMIEKGIREFCFGDYLLVSVEHRKATYSQGVSLEAQLTPKVMKERLRDYRLYGVLLIISQFSREYYFKKVFHRLMPDTKCNLCWPFMPLNEREISVGQSDLQLMDWFLVVNPFFWGRSEDKKTPGFVVSYRYHRFYPSLYTIIRHGVAIAAQMPGATIIWNGPGRSIRTHPHFQGVLRWLPSVKEGIEKIGRGVEGRIRNFPIEHYVYEGSKSTVVHAAEDRLKELLKVRKIPRDMIDLMWVGKVDGGDVVRIYIAPRSKKAPVGYSPWGAAEALGKHVALQDADFKQLGIPQDQEGIDAIPEEDKQSKLKRLRELHAEIGYPPNTTGS